MIKHLLLFLALAGPFSICHLSAQTQPVPAPYPRAVAYLSISVPITRIDRNQSYPNFEKTTALGFPVGVNILYSNSFGFSYQLTPVITAQKGISKVTNLVFDPGPMFRFKHGLTLITRMAFETQGRYGFTPVINKVYLRTKAVNCFVAATLPARFGNNALPSLGANLQLGFTFN